MKNFNDFLNESQLQEDYREFFSMMLKYHGVKSPAEFQNNKELAKKFYDDIEKGWSKGNGVTEYGKDLLKKSEEEK